MGSWHLLPLATLVLLAGCTTPPPGLSVIDGDDQTTRPGAAGLAIEARATMCDDAVCLRTTAHNSGPETLHIETGCSDPWREWMTRGGAAVAPRAPLDQCLAFGTRPMETGETVTRNWTWNGRLWDPEARRMVEAPAGDYEWTVSFTAYGRAGGEGEATSVPVGVRVAVA